MRSVGFILILSNLFQSRWFLCHSTPFEWAIIYIFEFLPPQFAWSPYLYFRELYLCLYVSPESNFGVVRLISQSSFEWLIVCPNRSMGDMTELFLIYADRDWENIFQDADFILIYFTILNSIIFYNIIFLKQFHNLHLEWRNLWGILLDFSCYSTNIVRCLL